MFFTARYSVINNDYGLMGVEDYDFEAEDLEEAKMIAEEYAEKHSSYAHDLLLDELEGEEEWKSI